MKVVGVGSVREWMKVVGVICQAVEKANSNYDVFCRVTPYA